MKVACAFGAAGLTACVLAFTTSASHGSSSVRKRCPAGSVAAKIGGAKRCLRAGKRCRPGWDAKYHRYGFHCIDGRLVRATRKQRLAAAPADCPGVTPIAQSQPPPPWGTLFGTSPLWAGVYATSFDAAASAFHAAYGAGYHRARQGWPIKVLWVTLRTQTSPISLSLAAASGLPLLLRIGGQRHDAPNDETLTAAAVLDPSFPGHPDVDDRPSTHEWGSTVYFPQAGCYRLDAAWPGGGWHFAFSFGR